MSRRRSSKAGPVDLEDDTAGRWLEEKPLRRLATEVLVLAEAGAAGLSLRLVDDVEMRRLNRTYLGRDRTTNVLSFPQESTIPGEDCLGDVVLAPATILRRAIACGREPGADVAHLLVHGVLHLQGYDHVGSRRERERMRARERQILTALAERQITVELRCPEA